jgi:hypothetical protein
VPFALGVAIANLFNRVAQALQGIQFPTGGSGGGGGTGGGGSLPVPTPSPPSTNPPPSPTPTPSPVPVFPPPVTQVPGGGLVPGLPTLPEDCPPLSQVDLDALTNLPNLLPPQLTPTIIPAYVEERGILEMPLVQGAGIPLEAVDFFRFRAISTSDSVPVSFFGRIQLLNGTLVPFSRVLTTSIANTIFETTIQTGPGFLLGAAASVPVGSIASGSVNAIGEIGRMTGSTFTPHTVLFSGQVDDQQPLSSTLATPSLPVTRPTFTQVSEPDTFAEAISITITPATGRRARVLFAQADCIPSATVQERYIQCRMQVGGVTMWQNFPNVFTRANQTSVVRAAIAGQQGSVFDSSAVVVDAINIPLPESLYFWEPFVVTIRFINGIASDDCENMFVAYEET